MAGFRAARVKSTLGMLALLGASACGSTAAVQQRSSSMPLAPTVCDNASGADACRIVDSTEVLVHLPASYQTNPARRYPVLYLLHGGGADSSQWSDIGATTQADALAAAGKIGEMILVAPSFGERSSVEIAGDLVAHIVPWVDVNYRTARDRDHRAVVGISRGGSAALRAAADHPDLFVSVGGLSPTIPDEPRLVTRLKPFRDRLWLDVGRHDDLLAEVTALSRSLSRAGVSHQFLVADGAHDRTYWRARATEYLTFFGAQWNDDPTTR